MSEDILQIDIHPVGTATIVSPLGDIDMGNSMQLRTTLHNVLKEEPAKVVLDLQRVSYMDSSGLGTLIEAVQLTNQTTVSFLLCGINETVQSIITLSKLDQIFKIHDSKEDALAE